MWSGTSASRQPGRGDMWACCPFHGEKTPSFHADDRRGRLSLLFGCGAIGRPFPLSDREDRHELSRGGGTACRTWPGCRCRRGTSARKSARRRGARFTTSWSWRRSISRRRWRTISGRGRAAISTSAAISAQPAAALPHRVCAGQPQRAQGASGRQWRVSAEEMIDTGLVVHARGHRRCPMTGSATG